MVKKKQILNKIEIKTKEKKTPAVTTVKGGEGIHWILAKTSKFTDLGVSFNLL